jgi:mannose/fructose/N-acetylgalactosamine-specific phosphotransferase system component IIB
MISLVRVDDRLIHGQVTVGWAPYLNATRIIVVSDRLAADPVLTSIVKAGGTAALQVDVVGIEEAARLFGEGEFESGRVILLLESMGDVRRALEAGLCFTSLNLGGLRGSGEGLRVTDAVFLSPADRDVLRDLRLRGIVVEVRLMPGDRPNYLPERAGGE